jgi:hypothetical protein
MRQREERVERRDEIVKRPERKRGKTGGVSIRVRK